jgi:hypothetical protein
MASWTWVPSLTIVFAVLLGPTGGHAQSIGPDEAVKSDGAVSQPLALTAAQRSAIYNAVVRERARPSTTAIPVTVGAPVSPSVELAELPEQTAADNPWAMFLKYAMVDDDIVVVDPIKMRVVDVIHRSARP